MLGLGVVKFSASSKDYRLAVSDLSHASFIEASVSLPGSGSDIVGSVFSRRQRMVYFELLATFGMFSGKQIALFSVSRTLTPKWTIVAVVMFMSVSKCGSVNGLSGRGEPGVAATEGRERIVVNFLATPSCGLVCCGILE